MTDRTFPGLKRRSVLRSAAATLGLAAAGSASAHPGSGKGGGTVRRWRTEHNPEESAFERASAVGYHGLGGVGPASEAGRPEDVYDGNMSEMDVVGDTAVISFRVAGEDDPGRRLAVLDVSEFAEADSREELEAAELSVEGYLHNHNAEMNWATDVKLSDDGNYAFMGTQQLTAHPGQGSYQGRDPMAGVQTTGGVVAVDITDRANPRTVGSLTEPFTTGIHNVAYHRIDGTDYVFACKDAGLVSPDSGLYVLQFDRTTGQLALLNRWSADGNATRGGVGPEHQLSYVHDVDVVDDPRTGRPTVYLADWDRGLRVLDATDPTALEHVGQFDMHQSHETTPVPGLVEDADGNERRVAITSHEEPDYLFDQEESPIYGTPHEDKTNPNSTGTVFLVDCDGIYPEDAEADHLDEGDCRSDGDDPLQMGELDNWTWRNVDTDGDVDYEDVVFSNYHLSPHNQTVQSHALRTTGLPPKTRADHGGEQRWVVHQSFYNLGTRYLVIEPGSDRGLTGDDRRDHRVDPHPDASREAEIGWVNHTTDWNLLEIGHARPVNETVVEGGSPSPDHWCAVEHNGVSIAGDRGAGVWVTHHDAIPLSEPTPGVRAERSTTGDLLTGSQLRVTVDVDVEGDRAVLVRDRVPDGVEVVDADPAVRVRPNGTGSVLEFDEPATGDDTFEYVVEVQDGAATETVGPVAVTAAGGVTHADSWVAVGGTAETLATDLD